MLAHSFVFVGADSLGELDSGSYIRADVPPGTVLVTATGVIVGHPDIGLPPNPGHWSTLSGCSAIDWERWASAEMHQAVTLCMANLQELGRLCGATVHDDYVGGGWVWRTIHIPACNPLVSGAEAAYNRLSLADNAVTVSLQVETGRTYYVSWSLLISKVRRSPGLGPTDSGGATGQHLEIVDAATGAKELTHLHDQKAR
jgi:hypothetical protein